MGEWRRLFYYLLLNVLVSAVTTLAVLIVWDKMQLSGSDLVKVLPIGQTSVATQSTVPAVTPAPEVSLTNNPQNSTALPFIEPSAQAQIISTAVVKSSSEASLVIENVIGAGDLGTEKVFIKRNRGEGPLSLANWRIKGEKGQEYIFPQITLYNPGAVYVHTMTGADTPRDLFWGRSEAAWSSGAEVTLLDPDGQIQASFKIP